MIEVLVRKNDPPLTGSRKVVAAKVAGEYRNSQGFAFNGDAPRLNDEHLVVACAAAAAHLGRKIQQTGAVSGELGQELRRRLLLKRPRLFGQVMGRVRFKPRTFK